ncbi:MAG TPA: serine protease [Acidimicrobiales bacterium]|jgi:S1-C subfamily serine protease
MGTEEATTPASKQQQATKSGKSAPSARSKQATGAAAADDGAPDDADGGPAGPGPDGVTRVRRLIPTTALGLSALLFFMGIAAAFSGAVLYAYYESRQEQTVNKVDSFVAGFGDQLDAAKKQIQAEGDSAKQDVHNQLDELQKFAASGSTLTGLLNKAQPSVWFVSTLDQAGAPSVGSAFVVFSDSQSSFFLTSYTTIQAATQQPAPGVTLRKQGEDDLQATVFTWDPGHDLALLSVTRPNLPALPWADPGANPKIGDRVFAISGLGSTGAAITQGFVADVSTDGLQHDAPVGTQFQGGPLLDSDGNVVAVASRTYSPLGFQPESVFFAPLVRSSCEVVLHCPNGNPQPNG